MSLPTKSRQWVLSQHPKTKPTYSTKPDADTTFVLKEEPLPELQDNQVLVQTIYLSNDPAQRGWIAPPEEIPPERLYVPPVQLGTPMRARGLGKILKSTSPDYNEGDVVQGNVNWREYAIFDVKKEGEMLRKVQPLPGGLSITHYLGALGSTGLTAYYGITDVAGLKKGERVVVSGAAGATGSMVVQIAKYIVGASQVIGIAGSEEKCRWVESLGADKCLNYKSADFEKQLKHATGQKTNVFFDNVAGTILDAMLPNMAMHGRIAQCGAITGYNGEDAVPLKNYFQVITMRLQIKGFIILDALHRANEMIKTLVGALQEGKLKIGEANETVVDTTKEGGFEDIPKTWLRLFEGANQGKLVTKL